MYLCRAAWHNLVPLARTSSSSRLIRDVYRNASIRQMSSGGLPGSSGENMLYALMVGAVFAGAGFYTYKILYTDKARYNDRIAEIMQRPKSERTAKQRRAKKSDEVQSPEVAEAGGEALESVTEEAEVPAAETIEQPESPSTVVEPNESPLEGEASAEEEVTEVVLPPAPVKESDEVQFPEVAEAGGEASESVTEEAEVPAADAIEQPESPSTVVEPNESPLEGEASAEEEVTEVVLPPAPVKG
ncbi:protein MGARP [Heptranchias perlo]|uniref:protein MGARP n=1 Tax=Heptranchias perlo TaxID=212740 RepID=UPI0035594F5C